MIKIICLIVLCGCFVLIGRGVKAYYFKRKNLYVQVLKLINSLEREITFLKTDIKKICLTNRFGEELDAVINNYFNNNNVQVDYLNEMQNKTLSEFFASLGNQNVQGEVYNLQFYKSKMQDQLDLMTKDFETKGVLSFKLISLFGVLLCIMFV